MTFAVLRALHAILGDALTDIEAVYAAADPPPTHKKANSFSRVYASPPPSPSSRAVRPRLGGRAAHGAPDVVVAAINRIIARRGRWPRQVQVPFLTLCDAGMGYHLPSCLRVLEAAHVVEVLRDGPVHVREIAARTGVEQAKLAHILRLLATHHILREAAPDVFAANRISSLIDSGKPLRELVAKYPKTKYASVGDADASAVAAFVGLCTDELFKSSAYLTEAVFPGNARLYPASSAASAAPLSSSSSATALGTTRRRQREATPRGAPFNYAFGCGGVGYFAWLEGEGWARRRGRWVPALERGRWGRARGGTVGRAGPERVGKNGREGGRNPNRFRMERFGQAMAGTGSWEAPGAVLHGFDWASLPRGSVVVDVGGGIGSTSMLLASAYAEVDAEKYTLTLINIGSGGLRFVIQDRPVVVEMGEKAWRAKCPELLDSGAFTTSLPPQPVTDAAVVSPSRRASTTGPTPCAPHPPAPARKPPHRTRSLSSRTLCSPLACVDDFGVGEGGMEVQVEGAEKMLAPAPLLANLGKASANAYWMDLTMQVTFNGQERTLREIVALALTAGWKGPVPVAVPVSPQRRARAGSGSAFFDMEMVERASSRCGTPTFGSRVDLPSVAEARARFGGGVVGTRRPFGGSRAPPPPPPLKQAVVLTGPPVRKKKPSPLSVAPPPSSPSPNLPPYRPGYVPAPTACATAICIAHNAPYPAGTPSDAVPAAATSCALACPATAAPAFPHVSPPLAQPPFVVRTPFADRAIAKPKPNSSQAPTPTPQGNTLRHVPSSPVLKQSYRQQPQPSPSSPVPSRIPALTRRASHAQLQLPQTELRKRSGSIVTPSMVRAAAGGESGTRWRAYVRAWAGSLLLHGRASGGALDFGARRRQRGDGDSEGGDIDDELSVEVCVARAAARAVGARSRGAD
ncbi:hypothetical protein B0H14DRAFT_3471315 [Mycena olivaceomarginata]|nr:hypothetical protein B0H14DRAFT_3471315 [Mycena olivaceomarginata]